MGRASSLKKLETLQDTSMPDPTKEMRYILDLTRPYDNLLATEGSQNQSFVWGNELLSASGESSFHYLSDHLGSPIRLMGESESDALAYDEFGVALVGAGNIHQPFGFTGEHQFLSGGFSNSLQPFGFAGYQADFITGTYYAQAREYDPATSRMISEDTHWNPDNMIFGDLPGNYFVPDIDAIMQSANLYVYCGNNSISFYDLAGNNRQRTTVANQPSNNPRAVNNRNPLSYGQSSDPSLANDLRNFNLFNTDTSAVKTAKYISAYKGQVVIKHDLAWPNRPGSFGAMFLQNENLRLFDGQELEDLIRHEYGHFLQLMGLGTSKYIAGILLPSAIIGEFLDYNTYYSMPWEIIADILGGVNRQNYNYLPFSELIGVLYHMGLSNNPFAALEVILALLAGGGECP